MSPTRPTPPAPSGPPALVYVPAWAEDDLALRALEDRGLRVLRLPPAGTPPAAAVAVLPLCLTAGAALPESVREWSGLLPTVVCAGPGDVPLALHCQLLAAGARRVFGTGSPTFPDDLADEVVRRARRHAERAAEKEHLLGLFRVYGLVGASDGLCDVFRRALAASRFVHLPVLILGETGTGKQLLAEAIHALQPGRGGRPLVAVNCGAISKSIAESELFGHARGAFTGAGAERLGLLRAADGGTLLLDEVGDLDPELQPKLLRVLQERRLLPVGEDSERSVDVRVISVTNRPLERMVEEGLFRRDLYQRLSVLRVRVPPLRERPEDVPAQARHFLRAGRTSVTEFEPRALEVLRLLPWPGNSRQLQNCVGEALALKESAGPLLRTEDLPRWALEEAAAASSGGGTVARVEALPGLSLSAAVEQYERRLLEAALRENAGNRTRTAARLGLTPRSVFNKIKKYNLA